MGKPRAGKPILWLVHPSETDGAVREDQLVAMGYRVVLRRWSGPEIMRAKAQPPAAVVIDLSKTPSLGRDVAIAMRSHRVMLSVPFVFVGGAAEAVAGVVKFLPDALESDWPRIANALIKARKRPPVGARMLSVFAQYEGTPLPRKLGIKAGCVVALRDAPRGFRATLGELPNGVKFVPHGDRARDLTLWFVRSHDDLMHEIARMKECASSGGLWIFWQKGLAADTQLTQPAVRKTGLDAGLVDFKIVRVDDRWSGLRFTRRK